VHRWMVQRLGGTPIVGKSWKKEGTTRGSALGGFGGDSTTDGSAQGSPSIRGQKGGSKEGEMDHFGGTQTLWREEKP